MQACLISHAARRKLVGKHLRIYFMCYGGIQNRLQEAAMVLSRARKSKRLTPKRWVYGHLAKSHKTSDFRQVSDEGGFEYSYWRNFAAVDRWVDAILVFRRDNNRPFSEVVLMLVKRIRYNT